MRRATRVSLSVGALASLILAGLGPGPLDQAVGAPPPVRLAGAGPIETSIAVSQAGWAQSGRVVVVADGAWPDALTASALGVPVLYTRPDLLTGAVADEIRRLRATEAVVVGGLEAVGPRARSDLRALGLHLVEVGGADRFQTAAAVGTLAAPSAEAIVVSGLTWADAVAVAPLAAARHIPVYLATPAGVPVVAPRLAGALQVTVVGGAAALPDAVMAGLPAHRVGGANRYETAAAVAAEGVALGMNGGAVVVAPSGAPEEAIAGGVLAGHRNSPMLLADGPGLPPETSRALAGLGAGSVTLIGRPDQVGAADAPPPPAPEAADVLAWVNGARSDQGLATLAADAAQGDFALRQAAAMRDQGRLFHQSPTCATWGEAVGVGDLRGVFDAWLVSPPHREVVFLAGARVAGVGVAPAADGRRWVSLVVCG